MLEVRGLCSDIINGQVAAVPIENSLSLLAQPHASKLLLRLRSHSLRSEAALKVFFGYMPHLPSLRMNRVHKVTKKRLSLDNLFLTGNFLFSQLVAKQVPSAFMCLTTVFGMGTGGAT